MTEGLVLQIGQRAVWVALALAVPVVGAGLAVGLIVAVIQASTSVNEQTLSLLPKLVAMALGLLFFGPWMLSTLIDFTRHLLLSLPVWA